MARITPCVKTAKRLAKPGTGGINRPRRQGAQSGPSSRCTATHHTPKWSRSFDIDRNRPDCSATWAEDSPGTVYCVALGTDGHEALISVPGERCRATHSGPTARTTALELEGLPDAGRRRYPQRARIGLVPQWVVGQKASFVEVENVSRLRTHEPRRRALALPLKLPPASCWAVMVPQSPYALGEYPDPLVVVAAPRVSAVPQ